MPVVVCLKPVIYNCVVSSGLFLPKSLTRIENILLGWLGLGGAGGRVWAKHLQDLKKLKSKLARLKILWVALKVCSLVLD